jgi:hypothetical protein
MKRDFNIQSTIVRVSKSDAAFLYFTLEANEGVCWYSTLDDDEKRLGGTYRDILIMTTEDFSVALENILNDLRQSFPISVQTINKLDLK